MTAAVWVQLAVGVATALVALFVMRNGLRTTTKVDEAARRTEWWRRTQWAIELVLSDEERRQTAGVLAVNQLMLSPLADQDTTPSLHRPHLPRMLGKHSVGAGTQAQGRGRNTKGRI